jgi:hypothetical protein
MDDLTKNEYIGLSIIFGGTVILAVARIWGYL